jgi:hypothetical protein
MRWTRPPGELPAEPVPITETSRFLMTNFYTSDVKEVTFRGKS